MSDRTETIKPVRIDLGEGDSLNLYRMSDYVTVVRFHGNNPNVQLSSAQVSTVALRAALDEVAPAGSYTRTDEEDWKARAEKAEKERDWYQRMYRDVLRRSEQADLGLEQPRPLTPDAVEERVKRAEEAYHRANRENRPDGLRMAVLAALTEPPARPEGAEEWDRRAFDAVHDVLARTDLSNLSTQSRTAALYAQGVRVVGEERS